MSSFKNMELEDIKSLTISALREFNQYPDDTNMGPQMKQIDIVRTRVEELMYVRDPKSPRADTRYANVTPSVRMTELEKKYYNESFNDLIRQGVLIWGKDPGDPFTGSYPWFSITTYGKKVLESGQITPHDSHDYLVRLKKAVPDLDEIVFQYVEESLQCYLNENLMAASVMLGVASEAAFYRLLGSFKESTHVDVRAQEKSAKLETKMGIVEKFKVVSDELKRKKASLDPGLANILENNLEGIFHLIRVQRNESGHPTGIKPDKNQVFANLTVFIMYCKTLYELIHWLDLP